MSVASKRSVLVVDDVPSNRDLLAAGLREEYVVRLAEDGRGALQSVEAKPPDLILLDIMMPGMNGLVVCRSLKSDPSTRDIPVLFLTSLDDLESRIQGFAEGGADYIAKPFHLAEVKARVRAHMALKEAREELQEANAKLRRSREEYRNLALRDNLTGLFNTRYLHGALSELVDPLKGGRPFSVAFMDIDNFKRVVDSYGHLNGSRILREVAATTRACLVEPSFGVAYGGDEFMLVLPGVLKAQAAAKAEEIRARLRQSLFLTQYGHNVGLSASFGVASFPEDARDAASLLARADQALFQVKANGKDGVAASGKGRVKAAARP